MQLSAITHATRTLTSSGAVSNGETVTVGGKAYTFQTTLTNVDGNVAIGGSAAQALANLKAAINLESGAGTAYAAAMTENELVKATAVTSTTLVVAAKVPGEIGNLIASTETGTALAWGGTTLSGGTGHIDVAIGEILAGSQVNAEVEQALRKLDADSLVD